MSNSLFSGRNSNRVRKHNVRAILLSLLHTGAISRVQLAKRTSLSKTTITNLTTQLLEQGVVVEVERETAVSFTTNTPRPIGRPRRMLALVPDARYVVGVHIGIGKVGVAIANLRADILHEAFIYFDVSEPAATVLNKIAMQIKALIQASGIDIQFILGGGVGASGLVDSKTGENVLATRLGWHVVPIRAHLEEMLNMPIVVDNNVRAMALGEAMFGDGRGVELLTFIYGRIGVGAGIVINGQIFRGSGAGAGEIGHTIVLPEHGELCHCGKRGCLETLISEPVIVREARKLADSDPNSIVAAYLKDDTQSEIDAIFAAARDGDQSTQKMIAARAYYLGLALANLANVLNPGRIILGGVFAQGEDLLLPVAEATMRKTAFARLGEKVTLQSTRFRYQAGIIGASALALTAYFYEATESMTARSLIKTANHF